MYRELEPLRQALSAELKAKVGDFELELGATSFPFGHDIVLHMLFMLLRVSLSMWSSFWGQL